MKVMYYGKNILHGSIKNTPLNGHEVNIIITGMMTQLLDLVQIVMKIQNISKIMLRKLLSSSGINI